MRGLGFLLLGLIVWEVGASAAPMLIKKIDGTWFADPGEVTLLSFDADGSFTVEKENRSAVLGFSLKENKLVHSYDFCGNGVCGFGYSDFYFENGEVRVCPLSDCDKSVPVTMLEVSDSAIGFTYTPEGPYENDPVDWVWTFRWELKSEKELFYQETLTSNGRIMQIMTVFANR